MASYDSMDLMNSYLLRDRFAGPITEQQTNSDKHMLVDQQYKLTVPKEFGLNSLYKPIYEDKPIYESAEEKAGIIDVEKADIDSLLRSYEMN